MEMLLCVFGVRTQIGQIRAAEQGERNGKNEVSREPPYPVIPWRKSARNDDAPRFFEDDYRTGPGMPEGAVGQSDKKKGLRQNPASRRFTAGSHMQAQ